MVKQYVTDEQEIEERRFIQEQSLKLFSEMYTLLYDMSNPNSQFAKRVKKEAVQLQKIINNRAITRRCYYCHRTKEQVELGEETATRLTQCFDCAMSTHEKWFDLERRERERERAMNG